MYFHWIAWLGVGDSSSLIPALGVRALRRIMSWVYERELDGWQPGVLTACRPLGR